MNKKRQTIYIIIFAIFIMYLLFKLAIPMIRHANDYKAHEEEHGKDLKKTMEELDIK